MLRYEVRSKECHACCHTFLEVLDFFWETELSSRTEKVGGIVLELRILVILEEMIIKYHPKQELTKAF